MNVATELSGEIIAKDSAVRSRAMVILGERKIRPIGPWQIGFGYIVGGFIGWTLAKTPSSLALYAIGILAGASFFTLIGIVREFLYVRRRMDALETLALTRESP